MQNPQSFIIISHTYVDVLKNACIDVHSDHSSPWTIYYKHHTHKDVFQVGIGAPQITLLSKQFLTNIKHIWMFLAMYV